MPQENLTEKQHDYAVFLPAISSFYATFVGKQQVEEYVDYDRVPFEKGVEALNFLNEKDGSFPYKWGLYSAGHARLDTETEYAKENMIRKRDRAKTLILGDSGGFQIGKGVWAGDWKAGSGCPEAEKKRKAVLKWLDEYMDYGMILDIPVWITHSKETREASGINTFQEAVDATKYNNDYFMAYRKGVANGGTRFLNVLQGNSHQQADIWYQEMKDYCDPKKYPNTHFDGWAMGGQNMCDIHLILNRIVDLHLDGLLQEGVHDWIHFLGTSKLEWAVLLTDLQRAIRKYYNPSLTISFDCASPFLATANGKVYTEIDLTPNAKWTYRMRDSIDDKKYAKDTRPFAEAIVEEGFAEHFENNVIMDEVKLNDVCVYAPGDLNKIGKEGKTSWDSFSYAIQMASNVWMHISAVQRANQAYDAGIAPKMLVREGYDRVLFKDVVNDIFSATTREEAREIIEYHNGFWRQIVGTRGNTGKRAENAMSIFNQLHEPIENECQVFTDDQLTELEEWSASEKKVKDGEEKPNLSLFTFGDNNE